MTPARTALGLALLLTLGCAAHADGPPEIVLDRDACSRCGMLISEARHAAAFRTADGAVRVFDDIGCLRGAAADAQDLTVWVHDGSEGSWMNAGEATFVVSSGIRTPMAGGVLAFRRAADAERAAARHHGRIVHSVTELLATKGAGS